MKTHPTDLHLEALYLDLGPEHRKVLDHLAGCARCRERAAEIQRPKIGAAETPDMPESPGGDPDLHVFPFALLLLQERTEAADLLVDLLRQPVSRREAFLQIDPRFRTWGFVELLVARSLEAATRDAEHAEELGRLALTASSLLDSGSTAPSRSKTCGRGPGATSRTPGGSAPISAAPRRDSPAPRSTFNEGPRTRSRLRYSSTSKALCVEPGGSLARRRASSIRQPRSFSVVAIRTARAVRCSTSRRSSTSLVIWRRRWPPFTALWSTWTWNGSHGFASIAGHNLADYLTLAGQFEEAQAV